MPDDFVVVEVPTTSQFSRANDTDLSPAPADSSSDESEISTDVEAYGTTQSPEEQKRRDDWSSQLSVLMLKGWRMLSDHCPETGAVPLMQARGETRRYSVATGKYYDEEGNELKEEGNANKANAGAKASPTREDVGAKAPDGKLSIKSQLARPAIEPSSVSRPSLPHASPALLRQAPALMRQNLGQPADSLSHHAREHLDSHPVSNTDVGVAYRKSLASALGAVTRKVEWLQRQVDETEHMPTLESLLHCLR